jgi:hypothetical protein
LVLGFLFGVNAATTALAADRAGAGFAAAAAGAAEAAVAAGATAFFARARPPPPPTAPPAAAGVIDSFASCFASRALRRPALLR